MNKRLTQDFFFGSKKTITENRKEVRQRVRFKGMKNNPIFIPPSSPRFYEIQVA